MNIKCDKCDQIATFFYEENINGSKRSVHLCADCAAKAKSEGQLYTQSEGVPFPSFFGTPHGLLEGLFGMTGACAAKESKKTCSGCGCTWNELRANGKAFCPICYESFQKELEPTLRSLHGNVTHVGRAPANRRAKKERQDRLGALRAALEQSIREENFEHAATLRDQIRALEQE